jgi:hypothetical protein
MTAAFRLISFACAIIFPLIFHVGVGMRIGMRFVLAVIVAFYGSVRPASAVTITFETLSDLEAVTNQFADVTFANATVLTAGISVNDDDFPPHSGGKVVFDNGGPISLTFATPIASFGGYFTYAVPLTIEAFSPANVSLGTVTSAFAANFASSGMGTPNEFLQLAFASGIGSVTITGDTFGGSFVLDDVTLTPLQTGPGPDPAPVPEPATLLLTLSGIAALPRMLHRRS